VPYKSIQKQREYQRLWMLERRKSVIISLGGKCVNCGSIDSLEIDHLEPSIKTFGVSQLLSSPEYLKRELQKCQVLCESCHKEKTRLEKSKPLVHGTVHAYKRKGCKCRACKKAWAEYQKIYKIPWKE
jgi:5-methylcytosine-specific restriction endonuclease McrA